VLYSLRGLLACSLLLLPVVSSASNHYDLGVGTGFTSLDIGSAHLTAPMVIIRGHERYHRLLFGQTLSVAKPTGDNVHGAYLYSAGLNLQYLMPIGNSDYVINPEMHLGVHRLQTSSDSITAYTLEVGFDGQLSLGDSWVASLQARAGGCMSNAHLSGLNLYGGSGLSYDGNLSLSRDLGPGRIRLSAGYRHIPVFDTSWTQKQVTLSYSISF